MSLAGVFLIHSTLLCSALLCSALLYSTRPCPALPCPALPGPALPNRTVLYRTLCYLTVLYFMLQYCHTHAAVLYIIAFIDGGNHVLVMCLCLRINAPMSTYVLIHLSIHAMMCDSVYFVICTQTLAYYQVRVSHVILHMFV